MGIREGFQNLFSGNQQQQQPAAAATPANTAVATPAAGAQPASSGSAMIDQTQAKKAGTEVVATSPLDPFNDLWKDKTVEGEGGSSTNDGKKPPAKPTEPKFGEYAKTIDFGRILNTNPELVTKALSGDVASFTQVINSVSQAVLAAALKSSHSMTNSLVNKSREGLIGELPNHFKSFAVANTANVNPAFNHPAFKPMVDVIKQQIMQQHPDALPDEINTKAQEYFTAAMKAANPGFDPNAKATNNDGSVVSNDPTARRVQQQESGEFDWAKEYGL